MTSFLISLPLSFPSFPRPQNCMWCREKFCMPHKILVVTFHLGKFCPHTVCLIVYMISTRCVCVCGWCAGAVKVLYFPGCSTHAFMYMACSVVCMLVKCVVVIRIFLYVPADFIHEFCEVLDTLVYQLIY